MLWKGLDSISDENLKLIPQSAVRRRLFDEDEQRNAVWDMYVTHDGRCFFSLCAEQTVSAVASLYEYHYDTNEFTLCFNLAEKVCQFKEAVSTSKIHTSITEINDGRLIMTSHTTARSPVHPHWHPEPFYNHVFEGFQGSVILIYDPRTQALENRGVPVPHESIYGAAYDPKHNVLYFTGYFRGHLYRYELDTGAVRDYGKVTEFGSFRLFRAADGNIYSASRSGYFYRVNTDTAEIEELGIFFPKDYEPYSTDKHVQLDYLADGPDGNLYLKYIFGKNLYRYSYRDNTLEPIGEYRPEGLELSEPYSAFGMVFDENGVLWYTVCAAGSLDLSNCNAYLCRWDFLHGGKPENKGLLGTPERSVVIPAEMHYHDGILYMADSNHLADAPGIFTVNLRELDRLNYHLSDDDLIFTKDFMNYTCLNEPKRFYKYDVAEYERQERRNAAFVDYIQEYTDFLQNNDLSVPATEVTAYPFWRICGCDASAVHAVWYEDEYVTAEFGNDQSKYRFCLRDGSVKPIAEYTPRSHTDGLPDTVPLPWAAGRRFKATLTAAARLWDGRWLCGTADGLLCLWNGESGFALGACPNCSGEVVAICCCERTKTAYGIIGSHNDIGIVFSYDDRYGVRYLGRMSFNTDTGLYVSSVLGCIAVNEAGDELAVGSVERMGVLYRLRLGDKKF